MKQERNSRRSQKPARRLSVGQGGLFSGGEPITASLLETGDVQGNAELIRLALWLPPWVQRPHHAVEAKEHPRGSLTVTIELHGEHERAALLEALEAMLDNRRLSLPCGGPTP